MYNSWVKDLSDSALAIDQIKETHLPRLISGKIHSVETSENNLLIMMDTHSGIDYLREDNTGLQGIAVRVQFGHPFNTFTIRHNRCTGSETEYSKRIKQIKNGYFYPAFTIQAYFNNRHEMTLISAAIVKTVSLYGFIENNTDKVYKNKSDNDFLFVKWDDMTEDIKCIYNY